MAIDEQIPFLQRLLKESITVIVLTVISYYFISRERELFLDYKRTKEIEIEFLSKRLSDREKKISELYERLAKNCK